ncbi:ArsR/SmtB family transcription factor [Anaeropeptidivorans aminofermentans]|uniref:ArsR/SmtB family transcription factor n=1 Tax=Anaeropeptidivorans aminofermentans TaxID=2934315 RepID=UPI002024DCD9|nr:metalloregulator ArsR/SmtB family transcription factor [Anaeropeptidivorans aminofermentans]MBE6012199.1 winged helix-turn-helix transcriptional regulator [Lachnospiraceae bacterium]
MSSNLDKYEKKAEMLKALAHPLRLRILEELCVNNTNVTALYTKLNVPQSSVSRHLAVLRHAGIVSGERNGLEVDYCLDCARMDDFIKVLINSNK